MFATFGENRLDRVDNNTSSIKIAEWKQSEKTRVAYNEIFSNHELLSKIAHLVFKQSKEEKLSSMHCAYILSICDILLNPKSSGIKCNDKSVVRRVNAFLVSIHSISKFKIYFLNTLQINYIDYQRAFEQNNPATQETMLKIAEEEEQEVQETSQRTSQRRKRSGSDVTMEGLTDEGQSRYEDLVS